MKGFKTFIFFGAVFVLGLLAVVNTDLIMDLVLPLKCHLDPNDIPEVLDETAKSCYEDVVALAGKIMAVIAAVGTALRFVTNTPIFKPE